MSLQKCFTIVLSCLFILSQNLFSQILVQGTVTDNGAEFMGSGAEPVANVLVTLTDQADPDRPFSAYTNDQGYYEIQIQETGVDDIDRQQPGCFNLFQNYPNPFNPATMISYEIPRPAHICIEIFNILGQKIKTLFVGFQSSQIGQVIWDATNDLGQGVSAGVYIYSLKTEDVRISKKMLLLDGHQGNSNFTLSKKIIVNESHDNALTRQASNLYTLKIIGDQIETYQQQNLELTGNTVIDATVTLTVTDIDGNVYRTVKIGNQWWLAENLRTTHYRNGDPIPDVTTGATWFNLTTGAYCNYENIPDHATTYGRLYNWFAVNDSRGLAPAGWHVPSHAEWITLENYLGGTNVAGGKLKEAGMVHWQSPNTDATNESGFAALPGGYRNPDGPFRHIGNIGFWWTTTMYGTNKAWRLTLRYFDAIMDWDKYYLMGGMAVRCIKD